MSWLIRAGMYLLSGFTIWSFVQNPNAAVPDARLALDQFNSMVLGVCAGLSNYTGVDVSLIRLIFALAAFYRGFGAVIYILAFLIMPVA
ncbi:MAG: PspC domain-containing protein [Sporomusaceae bacterium]|jgi:phage shock protein PspC (stress-responsive transcriptional regulator)|nr:PspC domain-containing protein [Sporomusaceae bacterium]